MQEESYPVFDPHNVETCRASFNGSEVEAVDEMDYRTLLLLYDDARKYAEVEQTSRQYWSVKCTELEHDCEVWRKAGIKQQKDRETLYRAFAAYVRDRCHRTVMEDDAVDEIIAAWIENEEAPL